MTNAPCCKAIIHRITPFFPFFACVSSPIAKSEVRITLRMAYVAFIRRKPTNSYSKNVKLRYRHTNHTYNTETSYNLLYTLMVQVDLFHFLKFIGHIRCNNSIFVSSHLSLEGFRPAIDTIASECTGETKQNVNSALSVNLASQT